MNWQEFIIRISILKPKAQLFVTKLYLYCKIIQVITFFFSIALHAFLMHVICICTQNVINTERNTHLSDTDFVNGVNVE